MHCLVTSVLKVVTYFNVFSYPLTVEEIIFFLDRHASEKEISPAIEHLVKARVLYRFNDFYSVRNDAELAIRRLRGNELATKHIKRARHIAKFLYWLPYIKGVAISGSLSKNFADENSDLDFFVITAANRLWIVRILYSVLYKIASLAGIKNWFCLNYFIDELDYRIKEHNLFTAVELSTLMPLKGADTFRDFFHANNWVHQYQPNYKPNYEFLKDARPVLIKRIMEWAMNFQHGNILDDKLHAFFKKRFEKQTAENKISEKGLPIGAYQAEKHACKPVPHYFQSKILMKFQECFRSIENKYHSQLSNTEKILVPISNE